MKKDLAEKAQNAVVPKSGASARGYEDTENTDFIIPRVELLQALSPAVVDGVGRPGQIVNSISKDLIDNLEFVPVFLKKTYIRWIPRDEGGGMVYQTDDPQDERVIQDSVWVNDNPPTCTAYLNFMCLFEGMEAPIILSFAKTGYKIGRKLLSMAKMTGLDMFASRYLLGSELVKGDTGPYHQFTVKKVGPTPSETFAIAEKMYETFSEKKIIIDHSQESE